MADPIRIGEFLFHEIDFGLLAGCEDGHRAEVWTKHDYEFVNIYLEGFGMGAGKVAMLRKSDNPLLVSMLDSKSILYAVVQKKSDTLYSLAFKERTEQDVISSVARARAISESPDYQIGLGERELKSFAVQKLISKYRPSSLSIPCALRTPEPIRIAPNTQLQLVERIPQWYVETEMAHVLFREAATGVTGYIRAGLEVRTRIVKAYFNGYHVTARITGSVAEVQRHALASIWDETEHSIEVLFQQ